MKYLFTIGMIILWLIEGICYAKEFHGFIACEIAHPTNCYEFVSTSNAACRDLLGTFLCHHNNACHTGAKTCTCDGPGIAEIEGFTVPNDCETEGFPNGWYHFNHGILIKDKNLKICRAMSKDGFGIGMPNFEQCFARP